jgi:hypothetical protein
MSGCWCHQYCTVVISGCVSTKNGWKVHVCLLNGQTVLGHGQTLPSTVSFFVDDVRWSSHGHASSRWKLQSPPVVPERGFSLRPPKQSKRAPPFCSHKNRRRLVCKPFRLRSQNETRGTNGVQQTKNTVIVIFLHPSLASFLPTISVISIVYTTCAKCVPIFIFINSVSEERNNENKQAIIVNNRLCKSDRFLSGWLRAVHS